MTITLELPPEIEARIVAEARDRGVPVADVIRDRLILDAVSVSESAQLLQSNGLMRWTKY